MVGYDCNAERMDFVCIGIVERDAICSGFILTVPIHIFIETEAELPQSYGISSVYDTRGMTRH